MKEKSQTNTPKMAGNSSADAATRQRQAGAERVICPVCPRHCALQDGQRGFCRARKAQGGRVVCENYGRVTALALDPIEKKPLHFFYPGSSVLSVGSYGCNLCCPFCQNHDIAQQADGTLAEETTPEALVEMALKLRVRGNIGLAFTYNEPVVGYEFVRDTARLAKRQGLVNVMVTNGYICAGPLAELLENVDAWNIDLKCFTEEGYQSLGGALAPVQESIRAVATAAHLEVTTLVVPGLSDSAEDMEREAAWLASISPEIPLHLSRYFPRWQAVEAATERQVLENLQKIAQKYLRHVLLGNC